MDATCAFVFAYAENLERYEACARHVRQELRALLRGEGLRAIVTSRAKGQDRLEAKLRRREVERGQLYASVDDVARDVHDLVAARVALYYPGTQARVNRLVSDDEKFERAGSEIPRAAQMLIDTTVGIDIWGALAASRVDSWSAEAIPAPMIEAQALSAG